MSDESFVIVEQENYIIAGRLEEFVLNQLHWMWLVKTLLLPEEWKSSSCDALGILGSYDIHCSSWKS